MKKYVSGFSLVEIAIVIGIIGLLVGGIFTATSLRRQLQLRNMMDEVSRLTQAYGQFKEIYKAVPGDMWNAESVFGAAVTDNGNGNQIIDSLAEQSLVFQHLSLAGLIQGNYTTNWATSLQSDRGVKNGKYFFWSAPVWTTGTETNYLNAVAILDVNGDGSISGNIEAYRAILTPIEASSLDRKYDDSHPLTGILLAGEGYDASANSCVNAGSYVLTNKSINCMIALAIDKKF